MYDEEFSYFISIKSSIHDTDPYIYRPPMKLREGNVFIAVCLSTRGCMMSLPVLSHGPSRSECMMVQYTLLPVLSSSGGH